MEEPLPKLTLVLSQPRVLPRSVEFDAERITLGRSKSCTCLIEDRFLSRTHAEIVAREGKWFVRDCGSANGTFVNGARIDREVEFRHGDAICIGDTEIRIGGASPQDEITQVGDSGSQPGPRPEPRREPEPEQVPDLVIEENEVRESAERTMIVHRLALELIEDRSMAELFEVIVDHVMEVMAPSRVAITLLADDGKSLEVAKVRGTDDADNRRLKISRTLLSQIIKERKVIAYTYVGAEEEEVIPDSMVAEGIFSALGAPLLVSGHVLGLLYLDYRLTDRVINEDDAQLAAQIARLAAMKLESTRLRETAVEAEQLDEALRAAREFQSRMIPDERPRRDDASLFEIDATIRPSRTVGGDFCDFLHRDDGLYFCIGDVSATGISAALVMAECRALFHSMFEMGGSPGRIMETVNRQLAREAEHATAFCGVIDLTSGKLSYCTAGDFTPHMITHAGSVRLLSTKEAPALGADTNHAFVESTHTLSAGDALCLETNGIIEAKNERGDRFDSERLVKALERNASRTASEILTAIGTAVDEFIGDQQQTDDAALMLVRFLKTANSR